MVALNFQTSSEPMWFNTAKFKDNGGCGYLYKPPVMMETPKFDPSSTRPFFGQNPNSMKGKLVIRLIGARQLPKPQQTQVKNSVKWIGGKKQLRPKVTLKICGIDMDSKEEKAKPDKNHAMYCPDWDQEFTFEMAMSEIALLLIRIDVTDGVGQSRVANCCVPVKCIREGLRALPLSNYKGTLDPLASLLVKFTWKLDS